MAIFVSLSCSGGSGGGNGNGNGNGSGGGNEGGNGAANYTVTFNSNGGSEVTAQTVDNGGKAVLPSSPAKQNFVFSGWYREVSCVNIWNFDGNTVTDNITLYAKWVAPANTANTIKWGVNIHTGGNNPQLWAEKLSARNLMHVRMDYYGRDASSVAKIRNAVVKMNEKGIDAQLIVFTEFSRDQARDEDYGADLAEVEQTAYTNAKKYVTDVVDLVTDFELSNEVPLYPDILKPDVEGREASDFDTQAGRLQAAHLKGVSRAIADVRTETGRPLRIILGTVNRYYGFIKFMVEKGVTYDVLGYHIYPWEQHAALDQDPWFGAGGVLGQLALFGKPIHINEFNSGEIYSGGPSHQGANYENMAGGAVTEKGFKGLYKHLGTIIHNQNIANIEAVHFYEACDEPHKEAPENRFGLFYDEAMQQPKISLLIATAFAGGELSPAEKDQLYARGFTYYNE